jgi:hypothetical protein
VPVAFLLLWLLSGETRVAPPKRAFIPHRLTACAVVTRADVEQAIGRAVDAGNEGIDGAASTCDYAGGGGLVSITVQRLAAKPDHAVEIASLKKEMPDGAERAAPGFADAFFWDLPGAGTQLHVLNGDREHVMVSILGFGGAPAVASAAERIARKAISRL